MFAKFPALLALASLLLLTGATAGQPGEKPPPPAPTPTPAAETPPPADAVAATVNGQPIPELAVFRGLLRVNPNFRAQARKEVVSFLVDNMVVDQYLAQLKIPVEPKDVEEHVEKIKAEAKKNGQDFPVMLKRLHLSEDDLRREMHAALRWDKFVLQQAGDKVLRDLFDKNLEMFNGSRMQARHILLVAGEGKADAAREQAVKLKQQIEAEVGQAV